MRVLVPAAVVATLSRASAASTYSARRRDLQSISPTRRGLLINLQEGGLFIGEDQDVSIVRTAEGQLSVTGDLLVGGVDLLALVQVRACACVCACVR
jgi:hypothetical protein